MKNQDLTITLTVDQSPDEVFAAINDVRGWWTGEITGDTEHLGGEFTYRYKDIHRSTQKITESVPGKRVVWHVTDSSLSFIEQKDEWTGTEMVFDIARKGRKTELTFTHVGLTPKVECYGSCSKGWGYVVDECLRAFITAGKAAPSENEDWKAA